MPSKTKTKPKAPAASPRERLIAELRATLPPQQDWRSSDEQEINRRRIRALENPPAIRPLGDGDRIHQTFEVTSPESGRVYQVEILDLSRRLFHSTSPDFATSGLGTCKHTEAVLIHLQKRFPRIFRRAEKDGPPGPVLVVAGGDLAVHGFDAFPIPQKLRRCLDASGRRKESCAPERLAETARETDGLRVSNQVGEWLERARRAVERRELRREYENKVHSGEYPPHETLLPLFPYQRVGMLHLAFNERAMVADEMGLGKTIQGIAAAALLHRMGRAARCLIVAPTSLKAEWEEQIAKFSHLASQVIYGDRSARCAAYRDHGAFFHIVNYEQVRSDALDINAALSPDIVILDEAQRIKNWTSQTARAIKRLESRYAFVLTGTPIENRIDELYSIVEFLDPLIFGALFRFNRAYYQLDERGKPEGYRNLDQLREKVAPILLRRRKADVETELPDRSDENRFIELTAGQWSDYRSTQEQVRRLVHLSAKRPLRREEHQRLMGYLGVMRMLCDTQYILDRETRVSPKLDELEAIFDEALVDGETKVIVFSEWVRMLELVRDHLKSRKTGYAWHTGGVPQKKRRAEIHAFKHDPDCRVFLCTESGGAGLNLQNASLVINVDLPWNPAKLEQRIARAWRKGQSRPVQVINLVARGTIEHGMLETLSLKQGLADGVLDGTGELSEIKLKRGGQSFLSRLEQTLEVGKLHAKRKGSRPSAPADPAAALAGRLRQALGTRLRHCEEQFTDTVPTGKIYAVAEFVDPAAEAAVKRAAAACYPDHHEDPSWLAENVVLVDEATHRALLQLQRAGLVAPATRARRNLLAPAEETDGTPSLTSEQEAEIAAHTATRDQHLKAAGLLLESDLAALAPEHLQGAFLAAARIAAVRASSTPPASLDDATVEPALRHLGESLRPWAARMATLEDLDDPDELRELCRALGD